MPDILSRGSARSTEMPLTARFKTIHWGVLSVELVVVVVGILGALWVDSWRQEREDRTLETRYLVRLHHDLVASREILDEETHRHETTAGALRTALETLKAEPGGAGVEVLKQTLGYATELNGFTPEHSTYEEMVATGNLGLITSDSIRIALSLYDRWLRRNEMVDAVAIDQAFQTVEPILWESYVPTDVVPPQSRAFSVGDSPFPLDPAALYGNRRLWNALNARLEVEMASIEFRGLLRSALESALVLIDEKLADRDIDPQ
jgi:hypothetical protein